MNEKIKIIIADDNTGFCDMLNGYLKDFEDIEILGIANTDEVEISLIEKLKPDIVITDLMRNRKYTGLEIIRNYYEKKDGPEFLVVSADNRKDVIDENLKIGGYIEKPCYNYDIFVEEIRKIKKEIDKKQNQLIIPNYKMAIKVNFFERILNFLKIRK